MATIETKAPRLSVVRVDRTHQAASDWQEGMAKTMTLHQDLGQVLEKLGAVAVPLVDGLDPAQELLNLQPRLLECVAFFAESLAMFEAAAPESGTQPILGV
jgi:hypothetical protein